MIITASVAPTPIPAFAPVERPEELAAGVPVEDTDTSLVLAGFAPTAEREAEAETLVVTTDTACDVADVGVSVIATTVFLSLSNLILIPKRSKRWIWRLIGLTRSRGIHIPSRRAARRSLRPRRRSRQSSKPNTNQTRRWHDQ